MQILRIGSKHNECLSITVLSYEYANTMEPYDNCWVESEISIFTGAFSGKFMASLTTQDFCNFHSQLQTLYDSLNGKAQFATLEKQIEFTLSGNGRGNIEVAGIAEDCYGFGNKLHFHFEIDQTYIPTILKELTGIINYFNKTA